MQAARTRQGDFMYQIYRNRLAGPSNIGRAGFTLIELLLVMVIIAILAAVVFPTYAHRTEEAQITRAIADLDSIKTALNIFEVDNGRYPTTEEGLAALVNNPANLEHWRREIPAVPTDPWGTAYIYRQPGANGGEFDLLSAGKDKQEGTADDINAEKH
jgi:general secretion pathway protein G